MKRWYSSENPADLEGLGLRVWGSGLEIKGVELGIDGERWIWRLV